MTVPASQANRYTYAGNGVTTAFAYSSKFLANADLVVVSVNNTTGVETVKTLTTDYTVTGAGTSAGAVTMLTAPASGTTLVIYGDPVVSQLVDPVNGDDLDVDVVIEAPLDRLTIIARRLKDIVTRTLRQPEGDTTDIARLPAKVSRASKFLAFDANGDPIAAAGTTGVPVSAFMETVLDDANAAAARTTLGAAAQSDPPGAPYTDTNPVVKGSVDATKQIRFEVDGLTAGATRVIAVADRNIEIGKYPTQQVFLSGSGTYTTPTGVTYIKVRMVGGGAGGSAAVTNNGTAGGDTTFGTLTAGKGAIGGGSAGLGGAGGTATNGDLNITGGAGTGGQTPNGGTISLAGGAGGNSALGGGGAGGAQGNGGGNAPANSGGGGGGGGGNSTTNSGCGGGAGAYLEKQINAPSATYSYAVGGGGTGGSAGTNAGGNGGSGIIIVDEFYN